MADTQYMWSADTNKAQRDYLSRSHRTILRVLIFIVTPLNLGQYIVLWQDDPCWQYRAEIGMSIGIAAVFLLSFWLFQKQRLEDSAALLALGVLTLVASSKFILLESEITSSMAIIAVIIYASVFSKKLLYACSVFAVLVVVGSELLIWAQAYPVKDMGPDTRLFSSISLTLVIIPVIAYLLRRNQNATEILVNQLGQQSAQQTHALNSATVVSETLDHVVQKLASVSSSHAAQTEQLSAATAEISASISELKQIAKETVASANESSASAESIRSSAQTGTQRLQAVEQGFFDVVERNNIVRMHFAELVALVERVEEIIQSNRDMAAQIKILAINASIQAAKAGEFGRGFRVVADELQALIKRSDESLKDSRTMLDSIRDQVHDSVDTLETGSRLLEKNFDELQTTGQAIVSITGAFDEAARKIEIIALSTNEQQLSLDEVNLGMNQIDIAVSHLNNSVDTLRGCVDEISESNDLLGKALTRGEV